MIIGSASRSVTSHQSAPGVAAVAAPGPVRAAGDHGKRREATGGGRGDAMGGSGAVKKTKWMTPAFRDPSGVLC